jgi:predicted GTPase
LEENVGGFDLLFRTAFGVIAIIALATGFVKTSLWKWVVSLIAFTGLYTSIMRHCSPYYILKINTAKNKQK